MFDSDFIERFNAKLDKTGDCWLWTASVAGKGYGQMKLPKQRKQEYAHRLAYMIHHKAEIPQGILVCHTCDTPLCCNPAHLFLGSSKDNLSDMASKDRSTHGEANPAAKLTEEDVRKIRVFLSEGIPQMRIAKLYGVGQMTISRISTGTRWGRIK